MNSIRIATISLPHPTFAPDEVISPGPQDIFELTEQLVHQSVLMGADFVCLPELFAYFNTSVPMEDAAESIDGGAAHSFLSSTAKRYRTNIVATVSTKLDDGNFNLGVVYERAGVLIGSYRKVHIPEGEQGISRPGNDYPVLDVEGLHVGMQICHDLIFPEGCRILALNGADVIFWPNQWGGMPEMETDILMRARAIENRVCLVSSAWVLSGDGFFRVPKIHGRSCVIDWDGTVLAEVGIRVGMAVATIDLEEVQRRREIRDRLLEDERQPRTYGRLVV